MSDSPSRGPLSGALETSHSMERPPKRSKSWVTSQPGVGFMVESKTNSWRYMSLLIGTKPSCQEATMHDR
ncbi:hypothetical protein RR46_01687 [Papilio xuthus]|uniref:Uncharacterized protein n=1 Tax=Papilio xuthus TaxID=66420 RepID=A0A0N0PAC8_PAPXU|nr:hypothetical protein RR46_01687 [Papilio xuthus]